MIPDSVTVIKNSAFGNCVNLENVTMNNSVATIGEYVFKNCIKLKNV